jgi:hypothetical protein
MSGFSPLCSHCGIQLPAELLFTKEKRTLIEADELKARKVLEEVAAEREKKMRDGGAAGGAVAGSMF